MLRFRTFHKEFQREKLVREIKSERERDYMSAYIFLDVDGVLLPFPRDEDDEKIEFPNECLKALCKILDDVKNAKIVLSSTWRCDPVAIKILLSEFRRYGEKDEGKVLRKIDSIDLITNPAMHTVRQHEIVEFVKRNLDENDAWIALDDDESVGSDMKFKHITKDRYVETESDKGLTMENAVTAVRLLRSQLNSTEKNKSSDRRKKKRRRKKK